MTKGEAVVTAEELQTYHDAAVDDLLNLYVSWGPLPKPHTIHWINKERKTSWNACDLIRSFGSLAGRGSLDRIDRGLISRSESVIASHRPVAFSIAGGSTYSTAHSSVQRLRAACLDSIGARAMPIINLFEKAFPDSVLSTIRSVDIDAKWAAQILEVSGKKFEQDPFLSKSNARDRVLEGLKGIEWRKKFVDCLAPTLFKEAKQRCPDFFEECDKTDFDNVFNSLPITTINKDVIVAEMQIELARAMQSLASIPKHDGDQSRSKAAKASRKPGRGAPQKFDPVADARMARDLKASQLPPKSFATERGIEHSDLVKALARNRANVARAKAAKESRTK